MRFDTYLVCRSGRLRCECAHAIFPCTFEPHLNANFELCRAPLVIMVCVAQDFIVAMKHIFWSKFQKVLCSEVRVTDS